MGENSKIEWTDHTWNPWIGCTKVSAACDHCYAEDWAKRFGQVEWGPHAERRRTSPANWKEPLRWDRAAAKAGRQARVFCASLADVFDNQVPEQWRYDLWELIASTRNLDWLLLTKRPQNIAKMLPVMDSRLPGYKPWTQRWPWPNVWLGTTVENQEEANRRVPEFLAVPAAKHFLSVEPLLGPVNLNSVFDHSNEHSIDALAGRRFYAPQDNDGEPEARLDWVIAGGESGRGARPMHPDWARSLRDQCAAAEVPFFMKQMTKKAPIPDDLMIREFSHGT